LDYLACPIPFDTAFIHEAPDELWIRADKVETFDDYRCVYVSHKDAKSMWMSHKEGYRKLDIPGPGNYKWDLPEYHGQRKLRLVYPGSHSRTHRKPQISAWHVIADPGYVPRPEMDSRALYDVLGTCTISGTESRVIGPLHIPGLRGGRFTLQITSAVYTGPLGEEFGEFSVESSHDGKDWFDLDYNGFVEGTMRVNQSDLHTGDFYVGEFYLTNHGEYIRIRYTPRTIAGWGFEANATVETQR